MSVELLRTNFYAISAKIGWLSDSEYEDSPEKNEGRSAHGVMFQLLKLHNY